MSDDGHVVFDIWIAIEELMAFAKDEVSGKQNDDYCDRECDSQRRQAGLFKHSHQRDHLGDDWRIHFNAEAIGRTHSRLSSEITTTLAGVDGLRG